MTFRTTKKKKNKSTLPYKCVSLHMQEKKKKRVAVTLLAFTFFAFAKFRR